MSDASITYFPVGNGDTAHIRLSDGSDILIDCNVTQDSRDETNDTRFDVHTYLLKVLKQDDAGNSHLGAFILTHPDQDHCRGFRDTFYTGDPSAFREADRRDGLIIIDELWFAPRIFAPHEEGELCESAKVFLAEARRRVALYKSGNTARSNPGNRLRVIGSSGLNDLENVKPVITCAGESINLINGTIHDDFSLFIHGPFKKESDSEWSERNDTSIVLQARFTVDGVERAVLALFGGDAECGIWKSILKRSESETLEWDLFLAPHHCSWTFFSEKPYKDNQVPSDESLEFLAKRRRGAVVIASCKPIKDDDDNPPHYAAAELYKAAVGEENFFVTMEFPNVDQPLPLIFEMTVNGPVLVDSPTSSSVASSAAIRAAVATPQTYG